MVHGSGSVLHVVLSLEPGGTERLVIELCKQLHKSVPQVICCIDKAGAWAHEATSAGIRVEALHRKPGFQPSLGVTVGRIARASGARVLHCHQYSPFVYGAIARLLQPSLRVVFTEHGRLAAAPPSGKRRWANVILSRVPHRVVAVSQDLRRHLISEGFADSRVSVIENGIDPSDRPSPAVRTRARQTLGVDPDAFVVGTVARLDPVKDLGTFIEAVSYLRDTSVNTVAVIVGDGPERGALEQQAAGRGIAVRFVGHRDNARALLPALDVFVNTSTTEGISVTILEAMSAMV
jgi:L-malate glycosyltransferase